MTITEQAKVLQSDLTQYVQDNGGVASVVSDLTHMWEQAYQANGRLRILICLMGEQPRGDFPLAAATHRVDRHWIIAVTRGRGFNANRGDSLTETMQNAKPLYLLTEEVRDLLRSIQNVSVEAPLDYMGFKPMVNPAGDLMDGYLLEIITVADLPVIAAEPAEAIAIPL